MKSSNLVRLFLTLFIAISFSACGGLFKDSATSDDGNGNDNGITLNAEKMAVVTGSLEIPAGTDAGEKDSAKVYVIGQEGYATTTDANGKFTLSIDMSIAEQVAIVSGTTEKPSTGSSVGRRVFATANVGLVAISATETHGKKIDFDISETEELDLGAVQLTKVGAISGNAKLDGEADHTGVMVYIPGTSFLALTDASGNYTISNVPEGTYRYLRAEKDGYNYAVLSEIVVTSGTTTTASGMSLLISAGAGGVISINDWATHSGSKDVTINVAATDNAVLMMISESDTFLNAVWETIQSTINYSFDSEGDKTIYIKFADANGLESSPFSYSMIVDLTIPADAAVSINSGDYGTSTTGVTLSLSATDDFGVTGYFVSESSTVPTVSDFTAVTSAASYSADISFALTAGYAEKTIYAWVIDASGNISGVVNDTIIYASVAPTGVTATKGNQQNTISWNTVTGATSYNIYWSNTAGVTTATGTKITNVTSPYVHTSLTQDMTYYYMMTAENADGESLPSVEVNAMPYLARNLPDTGQTGNYTGTFGEDHDYLINAPSYSDNGDGTITDDVTGLMWQKEDDNTAYNWYEASGTYDTTSNPGSTDACGSLSLSGYSDWRLPNENELMSIVNYGTRTPAIDTTFFPNTNSSDYWSSTTKASDTSSAWEVDFNTGRVFSFVTKDNSQYVRCVRGEESTKSFTDNGDGTVTDNVTTLMWQSEEDDTARTWEEAITYCESLSLAGQSDWRLPNSKELRSIVDSSIYSPAIDATYFPNTAVGHHWSSTTDTLRTFEAWGAGFTAGQVYSFVLKEESAGYARCVR